MKKREEKTYHQMKQRIDYYASRPDELDSHLRGLAREVSLERAVELAAGACLLLVAASLLQEGLRRGGLAGLLLRKAGLRTQVEIDEERYALKALRGDFHRVPIPAGGGDKGLPASILLDIARA